MAKVLIKKKVVLENVRFAFANVFKPTVSELNPTGQPKYNIVALMDPDSKHGKVNIKKLQAAIAELTAEAKEKGLYSGKGTFKLPLHDNTEEGKEYSGYDDNWYIGSSSILKPGVVDADLDAIIDVEDFKSGDYGNISLDLFVYDNVSKGIGATLRGVQKTKDGEALGASFDAETEFGSISGNDLM